MTGPTVHDPRRRPLAEPAAARDVHPIGARRDAVATDGPRRPLLGTRRDGRPGVRRERRFPWSRASSGGLAPLARPQAVDLEELP
ncbi:hypothetical protein [Micromonospora coxensis]|uniref:Uncharacterized protein n=1 Tax=Micromonospora coxensis TaxID=356852 RepID=A0A1C5I5R9_9ACTN|nr:hypothetical protein [Micromonospora coxensis]SCG53321.1 hypothetical protein GA0070614_2223 [Micromonospora coxensis]